MRIKILADSTCDLPAQLLEKYDITLLPLSVIKDEERFIDGVTITPQEIFAHVAKGGSLCSTAARNVEDYCSDFKKYSKDYDGVVCVNLGSGFSSCYQNAALAASEFPNVVAVDSMSLSTGQGRVTVRAAELADSAQDLQQLKAELEEFATHIEISFLLNRLDYMAKGGRCSSATALGANLLHLRPCIEVRGGKMGVVKKYRGSYDKCLYNYVKDRLEGREDIREDMLFLTWTQVDDACYNSVKNAISQFGHFENVYESHAGCTVSCHCGPDTLGIIFVKK